MAISSTNEISTQNFDHNRPAPILLKPIPQALLVVHF